MSTSRVDRQTAVGFWACTCFGTAEATNLQQRALRLLEEALELYQAADANQLQAHVLVDYVFGRPKGAVTQELGGVGITLLAFAEAAGVSADECERIEFRRILSKPPEYYAERNATKNTAGFKAT